MGLGTLRRHTLTARHGLELDAPAVRGPFGTDTPPLPLQEPLHRVFGQLRPGHQGPFPCRALPPAGGAAQPFDGLGLACPGAMRDIPCAGAMALCTGWRRARASSIALWRWRRQYHSGPPGAGQGPKDTEQTPGVPCYCSPGLPGIDMTRFETASRLAAWAGLAPGNNESAGKQRSSTTRRGIRHYAPASRNWPRQLPERKRPLCRPCMAAWRRVGGSNARSWRLPTPSWSVSFTCSRARNPVSRGGSALHQRTTTVLYR
jgi:hypothetical protein